MRRYAAALGVAILGAVLIVACGRSPAGPTPGGGGTGGGGNGGGGGGGPVVSNSPPTIKGIAASDTRVEAGSPVTLTASVEDADTPVANLTYEWVVPNGTVAGTGASVSWTPATDAVTPEDFVVTLNVSEKFTSGSVQVENKATSTVTVHVNNSPKELAELSLRFLTDFANSSVSPEKCVSEFSDGCSGKKAELSDIIDNRHDFLILASTLRTTGVEYVAGRTTATVHTSCAFTSRVITRTPQSGGCLADPDACKFDSIQNVKGDCYTTNVYEKGRWWICTSNFNGDPSMASPFARAFFGLKGDGR